MRRQPKPRQEPTRFAGAHPSNPLRPRDWRWSRIIALHAKNLPAYSEDSLTRKGLDYYTISRSRQDPDDVQDLLYHEFPDLHLAFLEFERSGPRRYMVEALIVAGLPAEAIADSHNVPTAVVQAYEDYFFDVRSRLHKDGYVISELFGPAIMSGQPGRDCDFFWKRLAKAGGHTLLETWWSPLAFTQEQRNSLDNVIYSQMQRNALQAATSRPTSGPLSLTVMSDYAALKQAERNANPPGEKGGAIESAAMLRESVYMTPATLQNPPAIGRAMDSILALAEET